MKVSYKKFYAKYDRTTHLPKTKFFTHEKMVWESRVTSKKLIWDTVFSLFWKLFYWTKAVLTDNPSIELNNFEKLMNYVKN